MRTSVEASVREYADARDGLISRRQLIALGVTRWQIKAELLARRWRAHGRQSIATHTGPLSDHAMWWYAIFEAGPRSALDGVSALQAAGLIGFTAETVRVSVPRGAPAVRRAGLTVRQTRRLRPTDLAGAGVPRVRPAIAAVRAGLWAVSDRQAATILAMTVQQRLAKVEDIGRALLDVKRARRRRFLQLLVLDLAGGSQSLGELDFISMCRERGLPEPDQQARRKTQNGTIYLDVRWRRHRLVLEVDGIGHAWAPAILDDSLRHNSIALAGDTVLRLPVLGLRVAADEFFAQVEEGLRGGGWRQEASAS